MVEFEGEIVGYTISIFIDPRSTHSYITPGLIEMCTLKKSKHRGSWLVQLATRIQKNVSEVVMNFHWLKQIIIRLHKYYYQKTWNIK